MAIPCTPMKSTGYKFLHQSQHSLIGRASPNSCYLDSARSVVINTGKSSEKLTHMESKLFAVLNVKPGINFSINEVGKVVWDHSWNRNSLFALSSRLRKKLLPIGIQIKQEGDLIVLTTNLPSA
jgi:hypothetical protein